MAETSVVREPGDIVLRISIIDPVTPANNPVTGEIAEVSIRRLSDDKWWDFVASAWDVVADYASLGAEHKGALTDKNDGSYERDWDQIAADGGVDREYLCYYKVTSAGNYQNRIEQEYLIVQSDAGMGDNTVVVTVDDGTDLLSGVIVHIRTSSGGDDIRRGYTNVSGVATFGLDDGTYYVQCSLNGYTHAEESMVVDESPEAVSLSMAEFDPGAPPGTNPACLRVYTYIRDDDNGDLLSEGAGFMRVSHYEVPDFVGGDLIAPPDDAEDTTDALGLVYLDLLRGSTYTIQVGTTNHTWEYTGTVPTSGDYSDPTISLATLVSSHDWELT